MQKQLAFQNSTKISKDGSVEIAYKNSKLSVYLLSCANSKRISKNCLGILFSPGETSKRTQVKWGKEKINKTCDKRKHFKVKVFGKH